MNKNYNQSLRELRIKFNFEKKKQINIWLPEYKVGNKKRGNELQLNPFLGQESNQLANEGMKICHPIIIFQMKRQLSIGVKHSAPD